MAVGIRLTGNLAVALLGATLYLLNFAVVNLQLAAMVDAGEACLILAVTVTLFGDRWWLLPIWGLLGALAKETFLPLAGVLALVWWYVEYRKSHDQRSATLANHCYADGGAGRRSSFCVQLLPERWFFRICLPKRMRCRVIRPGFAGVIFSRTFWYVFVWLLPLGLVRLKRLPRPWVLASIFSALTALALGVYRDIGGNVARPMFDVLGPILSLSVAILLTGSAVQTQAKSGSEQPNLRLSDSE